jgi:hypothetical protein
MSSKLDPYLYQNVEERDKHLQAMVPWFAGEGNKFRSFLPSSVEEPVL